MEFRKFPECFERADLLGSIGGGNILESCSEELPSEDDLESVGDESQLISLTTRRCVSEAGRKVYSRSVMEALRFLDVDSQQRRWNEIYTSMDKVISREYCGLRVRGDQKKGKKGKFTGKKDDYEAVGEVNLFDKGESGIFISPDTAAYGETLVGHENFTDKEIAYCEDNNIREYEVIDDDDMDDEIDSIQKPAFLVQGEPDFDSGPPLDGLEYLRRVRWEAAQIPKVKVALLKGKVFGEQTPYMPSIPDIAECPPNLVPSKEWEDTFLTDFSKLRQDFSELETSRNNPALSPAAEDSPKPSTCRQKPKGTPTLTAILSMDAATRASVLRSSITSFEISEALSKADCMWLYALFATVDAPLDSDTCASVRCLLRKCSSLLAAKSEPDDEVAILCILIAIAGKYFRQSEQR
ncbi:hypothetical protein KSP40_PGU007711 [Platanthera guangdongensis]|uniref:Gem-associated protein 2 n=1 Tax=Platanthera guangdongensis TaxID=2320717 RepID=A0ABR2M690_9ASPA